MKEQLIIIKTLQQLKELETYLQDKEYVSFDTETTGLTKDSSIVGVSVSADPEVGYYIVLTYWDKDTQTLIDLETKQGIATFLICLCSKKLIAHNATFDCSMIYNNFKIDLMPALHTDTMILGHLLNENRSNGLKELAVSIFGEDSKKEQTEMKDSVIKNGGLLTKDKYELYKADCDLLARYGAKDTILTMKLFYTLVEQLLEQNLDRFFYEDESMPLLKGPTYDLNAAGLRVDMDKLQTLKRTMEAECMELKVFVHKEIQPYIKHKYPGTNSKNTFNIGSGQQLAWLLFEHLNETFIRLTNSGRELCTKMSMKVPYTNIAKGQFIEMAKGITPDEKYWKYLSTDKDVLAEFSKQYKWVDKLLLYQKNMKILGLYIDGILDRVRYSIIHPSFLQHGTTSGRYSSRNPNFQNLPRDDKRIKECIIARPGKIFVGADYSQLEARVFASVSQDPTLIASFEKGEDFYSVIGMAMFDKRGLSAIKDEKGSFADKYPDLRQTAKAFALATPYGTSAFQQSQKLKKPKEECQDLIEKYFDAYPNVELMMLNSHNQAKTDGVVYNLFGRPRRIPEAKVIEDVYGILPHAELPYPARNLLNLSMNHRVQSTAASIVNRAAIAVHDKLKGLDAKIVLQVHDSLVIECLEKDKNIVARILQECMENTVILPQVKLIASPKIGYTLADV